MRIVLRGNSRVRVSKQLADCEQINACLRKLRGIGMTQFVKRYRRFHFSDFAGIGKSTHMVILAPCASLGAREYERVAGLAGDCCAEQCDALWV